MSNPSPKAGKFFTFNRLQPVQIVVSGERGIVVARSDSHRSEDQYLVQYRNAQGLATEAWWSESALCEPK